YTYGFFHLVTHAWFKACLFLASGSVIHAMHHSLHKLNDHHTDAQDIRNMGGLRKTMPKTYFTFLLATVAIAGVPLTSGFLSKDGILAGTLAFGNLSGHWIIPVLAFVSAGMTAFYMFRLTILSFHGDAKTEAAKMTHENNFQILVPLIVLAGLSIWIFYSFNPIDASSGWFAKSFKPVATVVPAEYQFDFILPLDNTAHNGDEHSVLNKLEEEMHHQHYTAMGLSLLIAGLAILLAFLFYQFKKINADKVADSIKPLYLFSYNKWYIDEIYQKSFIGGTILLTKIMYWVDTYIIDGIVNGVSYIIRVLGTFTGKFDLGVVDGLVNLSGGVVGFSGSILRKLQTGRVQTYLLLSVLGLIAVIWWIV
ncbi:MAG: proton-conducting transporter membrane subunit, partial [Candidatus Kapaibacterium sp.]